MENALVPLQVNSIQIGCKYMVNTMFSIIDESIDYYQNNKSIKVSPFLNINHTPGLNISLSCLKNYKMLPEHNLSAVDFLKISEKSAEESDQSKLYMPSPSFLYSNIAT